MMTRLIAFLLLLGTLSASAQDKHFTQFYASPLNLNPALTGAFEGSYRVSAIYRDQWRGSLDRPFQTFAAACDLRFRINKASRYEDAAAGGILFYNDRVRDVDFSTTQISFFGAYHKSLDANNAQFLSLGFQIGMAQRNINYESLSFDDQFNGFTGFTLGTAEVLPRNNFSYTDLSAGLHYTANPRRGQSYFLGLAIHHANSPRISFFDADEGGDSELFTQYSAQFGASIALSKRSSLLPRALLAVQGPHLKANIGSNVRMMFNDYSSLAMHLGSWVRPVAFDESGFGLDAVVVLLGLEYNSVLFGFSYDLNLRDVNTYSRSSNALEFSIAYLGEYENENILCPMF